MNARHVEFENGSCLSGRNVSPRAFSAISICNAEDNSVRKQGPAGCCVKGPLIVNEMRDARDAVREPKLCEAALESTPYATYVK